jgi:hypothetical protein
MPFNAKNRRVQLKTVIIPFEEETIKLIYRPSEWGPRESMELRNREGGDLMDYTIDLLARLIVEWDIVEDDKGPPMPITRKTLMGLDQAVINAITDGIAGDMRPNSKTSARSRAS